MWRLGLIDISTDDWCKHWKLSSGLQLNTKSEVMFFSWQITIHQMKFLAALIDKRTHSTTVQTAHMTGVLTKPTLNPHPMIKISLKKFKVDHYFWIPVHDNRDHTRQHFANLQLTNSVLNLTQLENFTFETHKLSFPWDFSTQSEWLIALNKQHSGH